MIRPSAVLGFYLKQQESSNRFLVKPPIHFRKFKMISKLFSTTLLAVVLASGGIAACSKVNPPPVGTPPAPTTTVGTELDDTVITTGIKAALLDDKTVKGMDVAVETRKGEVQLSGFMDNQAQIDRAMEIARSVGGVKNVANAMAIKK